MNDEAKERFYFALTILAILAAYILATILGG